MAGFGEVPYIEHGMFNPPAIPAPPNPNAANARGGAAAGPRRYPPAHVDRALFDGDVVKVSPLSVTTYLIPGHSPSSTTFAYTVRDGGKDYKVVEFCCWEYPMISPRMGTSPRRRFVTRSKRSRSFIRSMSISSSERMRGAGQ
jgi:hypothetical protein